MARPTKLTPVTRDAIVRAVRAGNYLETAAAHAGIDKTTLYDWLRRGARETRGAYHEFRELVDKALADAEMRDVLLIGKAAETIWQAAAWRLERRNPGRWGARVRVTVQEELDAVLDDLERSLAPDEYQRALAALAGAGTTEARAVN